MQFPSLFFATFALFLTLFDFAHADLHIKSHKQPVHSLHALVASDVMDGSELSSQRLPKFTRDCHKMKMWSNHTTTGTCTGVVVKFFSDTKCQTNSSQTNVIYHNAGYDKLPKFASFQVFDAYTDRALIFGKKLETGHSLLNGLVVAPGHSNSPNIDNHFGEMVYPFGKCIFSAQLDLKNTKAVTVADGAIAFSKPYGPVWDHSNCPLLKVQQPISIPKGTVLAGAYPVTLQPKVLLEIFPTGKSNCEGKGKKVTINGVGCTGAPMKMGEWGSIRVYHTAGVEAIIFSDKIDGFISSTGDTGCSAGAGYSPIEEGQCLTPMNDIPKDFSLVGFQAISKY